MSVKGYKSYKGKSTGKRITAVFVVIIVLAVLAAGFFFIIYPNFIVMTPDGPVFEPPEWLSFLFASSDEEPSHSQSVPPSQSPSVSPSQIIIETPSPSPDEPEPIVPKKVMPSRTAFIPAALFGDDILIDSIIAMVKAGKLDGVTLEMKSEKGYLNYETAIEGAYNVGAVSQYAELAIPLITKLKAENIPVCAYVSCFKDDIMPRKVQSASMKTSGVVWLDYNWHAWLNPYAEGARLYIENVVEELDQLGFDEIILDYFCFPVQGKLNVIDYGPSDENGGGRPSVLGAFAETLPTRAPNTPVSVVINSPAIIDGYELASGQELNYLAPAFTRLYINITVASQELLPSMLAAIENDGWNNSLIPIIASASLSETENMTATGESKSIGFLIINIDGVYS